MTPRAVAGRCRCVTTPPIVTRVRSSIARRPRGGDDAERVEPGADQRGGVDVGGHRRWPTCRRSAARARSSPAAAAGAVSSKVTTSSWPGRAVAAAPAPHSASRREPPKPSNAPAVASASTWSARQPDPAGEVGHRGVRPVARRARRRSRSASSVPIVRTDDSPSRTAGCGASRQAHCDGPSPGSSEASASECGQRRLADLDAVPLGVVDQRLRRVEAHRLGVEQRRAERRRVVPLEPGRRVDQQREADRVRLGEPERGERLDLLVDLVGDRAGDAVGGHAVVEPDRASRRCARPPRLEPMARRSWSASAGVKPGDVDRDLHQLLLEQRDAQRALRARSSSVGCG